MSRLPRISSRECVSALERAGFYVARQKGSHLIMRRDDPYAKAVVPHNRELPPGTLRRIIRDSALTGPEFNELRN